LIWHTFEPNDGTLSCYTFHKSGEGREVFPWAANLLKTAYPRNEVDWLVSLFILWDFTG
jgi:hypothetical protein